MNKHLLIAGSIGILILGLFIFIYSCGKAVEEPTATTTTTTSSSTTTTTTSTSPTTTMPQASAPYFITPPGTYETGGDLTVRLGCSTEGATIFYSEYLEHSVSAASVRAQAAAAGVGTAEISVPASRVIKAFAKKPGYADSDIATAYYEIWWWQPLENGVNAQVNALALVNGDLYAGGLFTNPERYIAKWNGSTWSGLEIGIDNSIFSLTHDGTYLYAGGNFGLIGDVAAYRIAKWDGSTWEALDSGMNSTVYALAYDPTSPTDEALYAGGDFTTAGGVPNTKYIARWNITDGTWEALGGGMGSTVYALACDDTYLYAGGYFTSAGGVPANHIARWNIADGTWEALDAGTGGMGGGYVYALACYGTDLYAGGNFTIAGGVTAYSIAKWNGTAWSALGSGPYGSGIYGTVYSLVYDPINDLLYAGGDFDAAGGVATQKVAKWDGSTWEAVGGNVFGYYDYFGGSVHAIAIDSSGDPYIGGNFVKAGVDHTSNVARWGKRE